MSGKVMGWVWDADLPRDQKYVLLAFAECANHDGSNIFPSIPRIAWMTGYSDRQVQRMVAELVKIKCLIPEGDSRLGTRQYRIEKPFLPSRPELVLQRRGRPAKNGDTVSPDLNNGDIPENNGDILGKNGDTAMSPDSSLEPSFDSSKHSGEKAAAHSEPTYGPLINNGETEFDPQKHKPRKPTAKERKTIPAAEIRPIQGALCEVLGYDTAISSNWSRVSTLAVQLHTANYTSENIIAAFGKGGAWFKEWPGTLGQLPRMDDISKKIKFLVGKVKPAYDPEAVKRRAMEVYGQ